MKLNSVRKVTWAIFLCFQLLAGCIDPYTPPSTLENFSYLVIDGILSAGDTSLFTLSRTQLTSSTDSITPETSATITIEEENGKSYAMPSDFKGHYIFYPGQVDITKNLRVHIFTNDGKEYASEYVANIPNPAIDSVSWKLTSLNSVPGVQLYANTHDPSKTAKYFLWRYDETWEFHSQYASSLIQTPDGEIVDRPFDQLINICFTTQSSTVVLLNSSTALNEDLISEFPLAHIPFNSPKLQSRYSLLLHQYSLTPQAYSFWTAIQRNTENLGTLFGTLPVNVTGNFTCITDPTEPVIGFFSATNTQDKRIFINTKQLPPAETFDPFYANCELELVEPQDSSRPTTNLFLYPLYSGPEFLGYEVSTPLCTDCRIHNGTTKVPSFW
jgi:hypothetical protein